MGREARRHGRSGRRASALPLIIGVGVLAGGPSRAHADGVVRDSAGAIASGRAGANVAHFDNGAILASNPAAMAWIRGNSLADVRLDLYAMRFLVATPDDAEVTSEQAPAVLPELSVIRRLGGGGGAWTLGFGVEVPGGFATEYHIDDPVYGRQLNRSSAALVKVVPALAWRPLPTLSMGGTLGVAVSQLKLTAPYVVQSPPYSGVPTLADVNAWGVAPTGSLGVYWRPQASTSLGASYTSESSFTLSGRSRVQVGDQAARYDTDVDLTWPRSVQVGLRRELTERWGVVSLDATWFDWSAAFDAVDLRFQHGRNAALPSAMADSFPLNFRDTLGARLGWETAAWGGEVRAGYAFHSSPVRSQCATPLVPATLENFVAVGYGRELGAWRLDLAVGYSWGARVHTATSAYAGSRFDDSSLLAESYGVFLSATRLASDSPPPSGGG